MAHASVKITANSSDYRTQMKSAAAQMKELSSEYSVAATRAKLFGSASDSLKAKAESLTQKITVQKNIVQMNKEQQERLTDQLGKQKTKQEELKTKVEAAKKAYEDEKKATGENSDASKALKEELDKLGQGFRDNETSIGKTETALSNQTAKTNRAEKALMEMEAELKNVNKELKNHKLNEFANGCQSAGEKIESFGKKMSIVSGGVAGIGAAAIKTASDFDSSMSNVQAISGASGNEMEKLRDKAREMGEKTKFSATEAGDAMSYMAMAGWKTNDMLNGIEGIMTLAAASGEDLASTSDIVTDAMTAFGLSADGTTKIVRDGLEKEVSNASHFADILAAASSNANTNVSLLGESFKYAAPVAGALGYSAEDTAVALGLMANSGIKASMGGTALRSMLTNLSKPTDQIGDAMDYLGISMQNSDGSMKTLMEVMEDLRSSFGSCQMPMDEFQKELEDVNNKFESGELTEKRYNKAVEDLTEKAYGAEGALKAKYAATIAGKTGMSGLLAIVGSSDKDFEKLTNAIYNSDGAAEEMAGIMQDNLAGQVTILKSQLQELGISIGEQLIPHIRNGVSKVQDIVDKFNSLSDSQKSTIIQVGLFVAAVGPAAVEIGKFAKGISSTIKFCQNVSSVIPKVIAKIAGKTAATAAGTAADAAGTAATAAHTAATTAGTAATGGMTVAQKALNLVMNMNPIMKVVAVVTLLAAGFVALYNKSETFRNAVNKLWSAVKEGFGKIKETITGALDTAKEKIEGIKNKFLNSGIGQAASKAFDGVKETASNIMGAAVGTVKEKLGNMKSAYEENGGGIKGVVAAGWEGIKGYYTSGLTFVDKLSGGKLTDIKSKFSEKTNEIKTKVSDGWQNMKTTVTTKMTEWKTSASNKLTEIKSNFSSKVSEIKTDWSSKFTSIKDTATNLMQTAKQNVSAKLDNMKAAYKEKGGGMKGVVSAAFTGIKDTMDSGMELANRLTGGKLDKIKTAFSDKLESAKSTVRSAIDKIKGFFDFSWALPSIKMPHFNISGSFSLNPPQVPSFGIEWYRKGGIMTKPTLFGINGGSLMAGGEPGTGGEAILPLAEFYKRFNQIMDSKLADMGEKIIELKVELPLYIDGSYSRTEIGEIAMKEISRKQKYSLKGARVNVRQFT